MELVNEFQSFFEFAILKSILTKTFLPGFFPQVVFLVVQVATFLIVHTFGHDQKTTSFLNHKSRNYAKDPQG